MTDLKHFRESMAPELQALNRHIAEALSSSNSLLDKIVAEYLSVKGKQIRPILVILSARLFGADRMNLPLNVIRAAASVEMLHNASLIHDDVVDQSPRRRGNPTVNNLWDNQIAVLVGDFFVSSALQEAMMTDDIRIVGVIARLGRILSEGEMDQIFNAMSHQLTEEGYYRAIGRKTASLFEACVEMGAYAVGIGSDDERIAKIRRYAELLGLCFQIRDDVFDYFDDGRVGKPTGYDLREGKVSLPLLHAFATDTDAERKAAMKALIDNDHLSDADIATLIDYAKQLRGIEYAFETMQRLRDEAVTLLDAFSDSGDTKSAMRAIFDFIIARHY
ncbi:MAG: polyprenyl synthetase family protein [Muribaculaceae bacterium]|mgnify:FL=1|nr:polyprenyl synthetase family protein [Muribaculaceae bacterium]